MKNQITLTFFICIIGINAHSSNIITNIVVYNSPVSIGSLYGETPSFKQIDRTRPEGTLLCLMISTTTNQVAQIYSAKLTESPAVMERILKRGITDQQHEVIGKNKIIFSFYYYGTYGPPHWFAIADFPDSPVRTALFLVEEKGEWRVATDTGGFPVRVAFFDLGRKHGIFKVETDLNEGVIDAFLNDCQNIDNIITKGMAEDPEHYSPVQMLR